MSVSTQVVSASFRADRAGRRISGLVVPWNVPARVDGRTFVFRPSSLEWHRDVSRVKLNSVHSARVVGRAVSIRDTPDGVHAEFLIARGPEGDEVLSLAEQGVVDGFSIEMTTGKGGHVSPDPADLSLTVVSSATLTGVALTPVPAFDDARVGQVSLSGANLVRFDGAAVGSSATEDSLRSSARGLREAADKADREARDAADRREAWLRDEAGIDRDGNRITVRIGGSKLHREISAPNRAPSPVSSGFIEPNMAVERHRLREAAGEFHAEDARMARHNAELKRLEREAREREAVEAAARDAAIARWASMSPAERTFETARARRHGEALAKATGWERARYERAGDAAARDAVVVTIEDRKRRDRLAVEHGRQVAAQFGVSRA